MTLPVETLCMDTLDTTSKVLNENKISTAQKMKFSIKDFFSKCYKIRSFHFLCIENKWT